MLIHHVHFCIQIKVQFPVNSKFTNTYPNTPVEFFGLILSEQEKAKKGSFVFNFVEHETARR